MPNHLQNFFADAAIKASQDIITALLRLPEEKRSWSPMGDARTAIDTVAECAILSGSTARLIETRVFAESFDNANYARIKAELSQDFEALQSLLDSNTALVAAAIRSLPDEELKAEVMMPWGPMTLEQVCSYPYWNMSYHEGQINYIASMLGCLGEGF
ncbi:DinB family protein [bacterium]|nr:MAG: DinB family protein [bacterium]